MRKPILWLAILSMLTLAACSSVTRHPAQRPVIDVPGQQADGAMKLPNQWYLRPVGKQIVLGDLPVNIAVHPGGKFAAVLHCGNGQHEITIVEIPSGKLVSRAGIDEAFYGLAFSQDGKKIFCSGAGDEAVYSFTFADGYLFTRQKIKLRPAKQRAIPAGLCVSSDGKTLFVANVWGHRITEVDLETQEVAGEILLGTNALMVVEEKKPADEDEAAIIKRAEALLDQTKPSDPFPYACVLDEKRRRLYVTLWAQSSVAVIDLQTRKVLERWAAEEHPNEILLSKSGKHLFVANANRNTVSVIETEAGKMVETLLAELLPHSPPGNTPNSLALSPDEKTLFVANANINTVAVFDISELGKSRSLGFIPVGWYPTSVRVTPDGKRLLVTNGKGILPKANPHGPQPGKEPPASVREYLAGLLQGTLSIIELPGHEKFEQQMKRYTARAYRCMPTQGPLTSGVSPDEEDGSLPPGSEPQSFDHSPTSTPIPPGRMPGATAGGTPASKRNPIPIAPGGPTPIKYVIYVVKENRTYDQMLGDMPEGNGDANLCLFPQRTTPNHHKLAREFVLLDNFYVESEVSADGHEWTMGAYATDFVEKTWPLSYGHNKHKKYPYPAEGNFPIAAPAGGYLWDRAREAGVSYRSYGEFISNGKTTNAPGTSRVAALKGHFDPWYRGFDTDYADVRRAHRFISELKRFEQEGEMPRLQVVRLPNDHTSGTTTNKLTPTAQVGDNDVALGMFVEAVSRSKFWPQTAIFVVEDDAQNGPDHVDAHRTIAFVISPYAKRGAVDSTMYSTSSMLRTMELILGLKPMSQFDGVAMPMFNSFQAKPDLRPYKGLPALVDLNEKNSRKSWGNALSAKMDFSKEDAADDLVLNEVIWRSVRGPDHPMPAATRAAFVFPHAKVDDD